MKKMPVKKKSSALKRKTTSGAATASSAPGPVQAKIKKLPGLNKGTDVTLKRGAVLADKPAVTKKDAKKGAQKKK
jgi:hypothetical protein